MNASLSQYSLPVICEKTTTILTIYSKGKINVKKMLKNGKRSASHRLESKTKSHLFSLGLFAVALKLRIS